MSRASGSLPNVPRRSLSTSSLQRRSAKHLPRSPSNLGRTAKKHGSATALPQIVPPPKGATLPELAVAEDDHVAEVCAICLDPLDEGAFNFPCGHDHKLHYPCAIHFLGSALSLPSDDGTEGPLSPSSVRGMGSGFRAIGTIEDGIRRAPPFALNRMSCPLCRRDWPSEDAFAQKAAMLQLRAASVVGLQESAGKMLHGWLRVLERLEHGEAERLERLKRGLTVLRHNRHTASSFFAHRVEGDPPTTAILLGLRHGHVGYLAAVARACRRICRGGGRLRAPHLCLGGRLLRAAAHRVWAPGVVSLHAQGAAHPSARSGIAGVDAVAFSEWLRAGSNVAELVFHGLQWERVDPGGLLLEACVAGKRLRQLELSHNGLTDASMVRLAGALLAGGPGGCLESVVLDLNCITEAGLRAVLPLDGRVGRVRTWGFRHNKLADGGCRAIADAEPGVAAWDLRTNGLTTGGCKAIAPALERMAVARLGCNPLGDAGLMYLSPGIGERLEVLDLRQGRFGDGGALELAYALVNASSLQELLLSGNEIGSHGAWALAEAWRWLMDLHYVDLSGNAIGSSGVERIADELPYWKQSPFRLSLIGVGLGVSGVARLAAVLQSHPRHEWQWTIDLQNNDPGITRHATEVHHLLEGKVEVDTEGEEEPGFAA